MGLVGRKARIGLKSVSMPGLRMINVPVQVTGVIIAVKVILIVY